MRIRINGEVEQIPDDSSVEDVLTTRKLLRGTVVIELNGEIIKRDKWAILRLNSDDNLELIRMIGGG